MEPNYRIRLLGPLQIEKQGASLSPFRTQKTSALLGYLVRQQQPVSRSYLADLLWGDHSESRGRRNLSNELSHLSAHLPGFFEADRQMIHVRPTELYWIDTVAFEQLTQGSRGAREQGSGGAGEQRGLPPAPLPRSTPAPLMLAEAVALYRGDFMAGFSLDDCPEFEMWLQGEQEYWRRRLGEVLERLIEHHADQKEDDQAQAYARRWLALEPWREEAHRYLMILLARSGQRSAALAQYENCRRILAEELAVEPAPETTALYERIRAGEIRSDISPRADRLIRGYELRERIGEGGFAVVYRAYQPQVGRDVAIKIIQPHYANQADFIRRFEVEAHLVARLEHPYIVPLYDYWREPDGAYLVMRWLRAGSLQAALQRGPWKVAAAVGLVDQITAALAAAHQQGIVHRDIKPANILLDEAGNAYLSDFGIAKELSAAVELTDPGAIKGSPAYVSPEQVESQPVTPLADIYNLGVILYELLTAEHPFPNQSLAALLMKHLNEPLPLVQTRRPDLPPAVDEVIQRATAKDPAQRYPDPLALAVAFRQAVTPADTVSPLPLRPATPQVELTNPYKGLRPFQEADAADFFGREALTEQLLARLREAEAQGGHRAGEQRSTHDFSSASLHLRTYARFLAVVGPSGSGKSSVVRAGLIPALRRGALPGSENWFVVQMLPGAHPLEELEAALLRIAINPPESLFHQMREDERGLLRAINRSLPGPESELLLVIDQFEEIFTLVKDETERERFLDGLLVAVSDPRSRLRLVVTLRADFYDRPLLYPIIGELMRQRTEVVLPLSASELERAIAGPAERVGVRLEQGLVAAILGDVSEQPGALPLLQYAMTELFERREDHTLTRAAYQASGGVLGALARRADELYTRLDANGQEVARQLFLRLVTLGAGTEDTRRRVLRAELEALTTDTTADHRRQTTEDTSSPTRQPGVGWSRDSAVGGQPLALSLPNGSAVIGQVIDQFGHYRLLSFDRDPVTRGPTVEVAHEALLREWARLRDWLADSRAGLRLQRQLATATAEWQAAQHDPSFLLLGARLAQFELWAADTGLALTTSEHEFLQASLAERDRQQAEEQARQARELALQKRAANWLRWLVAGLAVFLLIAAGLAAFAFSQQTQAEANFTRAEAQRLAAEANTLVQAGDNAEVIGLLAVKSLAVQYSPQGDSALQAAAALDYPQRILAGHEDSLWAVAFAPDGQTVLSGSADGTARLWDVASGKQVQEFRGHEDEVVSVAFAPDGRTVLTGSSDQTARLWDVKTGQELRQFNGPDGPGSGGVKFSPDGRSVLTGSYLAGVLHLWDVETGVLRQTFTSPDAKEVNGVAFSPDGRQVAAALGVDRIIRAWDSASGELLQTFKGSTDGVLAVVFSPTGQTLASGGYDKTARLWDIATGAEIRRFEGHTDAVESVSFSPDGRTLITASDDRTGRLWDVETGQELRRLAGHASPVIGAVFAPDGKTIATASFDQTIKLWASQSQPEYPQLAGVNPNSFSNAVKFASDGRAIVGASEIGLRLWDVQTGQPVRQYDDDSPLLSAAISPDGSLVLGGTGNGTLVGWDTHTGEKLFSFSGHQVEVSSVAISPDARYALTAGASDGTARLWDLAAVQAAQVLNPEAGFVLDVAFSADGRYALASATDGLALMWAVEGGQLVREFELAGPVGAPSLAVSPDGKLVAIGSRIGEIALFDLDSGQQQEIITGHVAGVRDLAFSLDGKLLLSGSADGTARLWDVASGAELRRYNRRPFTVHSVAFAPDGRTVLVAATDGVARRYDVDLNDTIRYLCRRLQRDFSDDERAQYEIAANTPTCR